MPYTNPDGTAAYLINGGDSGGFLIADLTKAGLDEAYAQKLTISGSGAVYSDCTISSGGSVVVGTKTVLSGANVLYTGGLRLPPKAGQLESV